LHDFTGRSRKPQIALAAEFGFDEFAQPAGGCCFLTDESYSKKLVDLWRARGKKDYELDDIMLLKVGRHIRPQANYKIIVARDEGEGRFLQGYKNDFISLHCESHPGPLVLVDGTPSAEDLFVAAKVTARYGQGRDAEQVEVAIRTPDGLERMIQVTPFQADEIPQAWYL
ncbi:MAG: tRNA (5-methylaminomethyl-2-thiouridylate)-methyltransferase, partial [Methylococcales bacterium]